MDVDDQNQCVDSEYGDGDSDNDSGETMVIFTHSLSGELFPLVADLGDILQSRCGDHDHGEVDGGFDNHDKKKEGGYTSYHGMFGMEWQWQ